MEPVYGIVATALKLWGNAWFTLRAENLEAIPGDGPAIVAFNHIAYLDALAAAYVVDKAGRRPRFLAKAELFDDWKAGWIMRGTRQIPVRRGTRDAPAALDSAVDALEGGEVVVVFPEGSASTDRTAVIRPPKTGAARLALATGAPLVPGALWGTQNVWPKDAPKDWRPGQPLHMRLGEPFLAEGTPTSYEDVLRTGKELMGCIASLLDELRPLVSDRRL